MTIFIYNIYMKPIPKNRCIFNVKRNYNIVWKNPSNKPNHVSSIYCHIQAIISDNWQQHELHFILFA